MKITQIFYDNLASQFDKLFLDWKSVTMLCENNLCGYIGCR